MKRILATLLVVGSALILAAPSARAQHAGGSADSSASARQMTEAAVAFLESLEPAQLDAVTFALDDEVRSNWSNVPPYAHPRPGLKFGDLSEPQRVRLHNLLRASLSSQGYQKVAGVMRLDDINRTQQVAALRADSTAYSRALAESFGSRNYAVAIFADPRADASWGWLLQGHHLGASFTVSAGRVGFLPLFLGATPLTVEEPVETGWSALSHEVTRGFELLQSLTQSQRKAAVSDEEVPGDVLNGVGRKGKFTEEQGLRASDMTSDQQRLLRILVEEYVRNADFDTAEAQLAAIGAEGWDKLWLSWRGSVDDPAEPFYYRVQGPRIVIECRNSTNHIHTIVRDPANDYGESWLSLNYDELITAAERSAAARQAAEPQ
jgi:hypothetical protein